MNLSDLKYDDIKIDNPVNIDLVIDELQRYLPGAVAWLDIAFGRAYRNKDNNGSYKPEIYIGNNEYISVFPDDMMNFCFFDVDEVSEYDKVKQQSKQNIRIIFFVNLAKSFPTLKHRADANAHQNVLTALKQYVKRGFTATRIVKGIENVYKNYSYNISQQSNDMQPFHVFSIEATVNVPYHCVL